MDGLLILLSITAAGGLWLRFVYRYDKVEPEPIWTVLRIGVFGGLTAAVLAVIGNGLFEWITGLDAGRRNSFLGSFFLAGFVGLWEELCKAFAAVLFLDKL
ncbi:MAG TPA: PrsW family glutamic-type intramembrane protease, partial [Leptospiraceae bacterium]|nr:PrsW family glutamic-type intramembrane protease [Leptospiraceae bacterium]